MASCPAFVEDSCQNRALRKRFAAAASFSFERGKERLDTFPQLIRHITKICLFHGTRLPYLLKSKNMPDILLYEIIDSIINIGSQHTFFVLTKRPERIKKVLTNTTIPQNLWLGTTVCNQSEADAKIPLLLQIQEEKNFVSIEPMLEPIDVTRYSHSLKWVICGGETGPGARPMHSDWARSLRDQCIAAGTPFFFKKMGNQKTAPKDLLIREVPNELETLPRRR